MVLNFIGRFFGADPIGEDPEFPGRTPDDVRRRRHERLRAERETQDGDLRRKEENDDQWQILAGLAAHRRALEQLGTDIADARAAIAHAHDRAALEEESARRDFDDARGRAITLADGRLVYFTADGSALYGEEGNQIRDARTVAEARQKVDPSSTTHEEFLKAGDAVGLAAENSERLRNALADLDRIETRLSKNPSPEELKTLRENMDQTIAELPPDARAEYEQLRAARQAKVSPSYRAADPAFESTPVLNSDFRRAVTAAITPPADDSAGNDRKTMSAYREAPDF